MSNYPSIQREPSGEIRLAPSGELGAKPPATPIQRAPSGEIRIILPPSGLSEIRHSDSIPRS